MEISVPRACTLNRELSWLAFNLRVLEEADLPERPLLDRLTFLGIFQSNLDEFFRVRVGTLIDAAHAARNQPQPPVDDKTGWSPEEQLAAIRLRVAELMTHAERTSAELVAALTAQGIAFPKAEKLEGPRALAMTRFFKETLKPLLSPLFTDARCPFPFLRDRESAIVARFGRRTLGIIPLGSLPAFHLFADESGLWLLHTPDIVRLFAPRLFGRGTPDEALILRVTRNADLSPAEGEEEDFAGIMRDFIRKRKRLAPVRLQVHPAPSPELAELLTARLKCPAGVEPITQSLPLGPEFAFGLAKALPAERAQALSAPRRKPSHARWAEGAPIAERIREQPRLLCTPFESLTPFVRLLEEAAEDPEVTAIRITLYRLAANSRIAQALARAAEHGKDVLCLLELRARFDEESNINYAEMLQEAGCTVLYGLPHCKVHAKVCLILYRPDSRDGSPRAITQIGTGNYNEKTAALYTDLSYLTADPDIAADAAALFRALCRGESAHHPRRLWVAPESFLSRLLAELDTEIAEARAGRPAAVFIKANGLNSLPVIAKLIECSQAGVPVELYIRGICCLRAGIPGLTDRITIRSIVGDHLEHSRILAFGPPGHERLFIGSGDLLNRNLTRRVEVYTPILDAPSRRELLELIELLRADTAKARQMSPDGTYALPTTPAPRLSSQARLREHFAQRNARPPALPAPTPSRLRRLLSRWLSPTKP